MQNKITQAEFDKQINLIKQEYEQKLQEQKERILQLREENNSLNLKLNSYSIKDESISRALVLAVEKAKELENSSKNLYELEIQRIRILYNRWEKLLNLIVKKYPNVKAINEINNLITEFNESITQTINSAFVVRPEEDKTYVKTLLNRMSGYVSSRVPTGIQPTPQPLEKLKVQEPSDIKRFNENQKPTMLNLVDKFLNDNNGEELSTAYAKKIAPILNQKIEEKIENYMKNKTDEGFDLSEAVCPKETLEDIMKAFDFYPDNDEE